MLDVGPSRSDGTGDWDGGADGGLAKARAYSPQGNAGGDRTGGRV